MKIEARSDADFQALFPKLTRLAGDVVVSDWIRRFDEAFPIRDWERFETFRSFPLFLRNEKRLGRLRADSPKPFGESFLDLALWEWSEFAALYSPADESRDRRSLKPLERMLNPTLQILRLEFDIGGWIGHRLSGEPCVARKMVFMYRSWTPDRGFHLRIKDGDVALAAILDPLLEGGRVSDHDQVQEVEAHAGPGPWRERIRLLVSEDLILEGP